MIRRTWRPTSKRGISGAITISNLRSGPYILLAFSALLTLSRGPWTSRFTRPLTKMVLARDGFPPAPVGVSPLLSLLVLEASWEAGGAGWLPGVVLPGVVVPGVVVVEAAAGVTELVPRLYARPTICSSPVCLGVNCRCSCNYDF